MKSLAYRPAISLAVAQGASTPVAVVGTEIWSTTANKLLYYDGDSWEPYPAPVGDVVGPASSVAGHLAEYADSGGNLLLDSGSGKFKPELIWTATSNLATKLTNSVETLSTFDLAPGESAIVKLHYAYRLSVTTMGATLGLHVANVGGNSVSGSYQLFQCVNTATATNVLSVGGALYQGQALAFYQTASSVASSANANLGFSLDALVKNEHATNALTITLLFGTLGSGTVTVMTGSMAMLIRL